MLAFVVLLLAIFSRLLPLAFHGVSWNFTALGGGLLFFGSRMTAQRESRGWLAARLGAALLLLMGMDVFLTTVVYGFAFHPGGYVVTWAWYLLAMGIGMGLLHRPTVLKVVAGALASATSFYVLVDFAVWANGHLWPHTANGLAECYIAAIPFYRNDVVSTLLTAGVLFGLNAVAARAEASSPLGGPAQL